MNSSFTGIVQGERDLLRNFEKEMGQSMVKMAGVIVKYHLVKKAGSSIWDFIGSTGVYLLNPAAPPTPEDTAVAESPDGYWGLKWRLPSFQWKDGSKFHTITDCFVAYGRRKKRFVKVKITMETDCHPLLIPVQVVCAWGIDALMDLGNLVKGFWFKMVVGWKK